MKQPKKIILGIAIMALTITQEATFNMANAGQRDNTYIHSFNHIETPERIDIFQEKIEGVSAQSTLPKVLDITKENGYESINTSLKDEDTLAENSTEMHFIRENGDLASHLKYIKTAIDENFKSVEIEYRNGPNHKTYQANLKENLTSKSPTLKQPNLGGNEHTPMLKQPQHHTPFWTETVYADEIKSIIDHYCHPESTDSKSHCMLRADRVLISITDEIKIENTTKTGQLDIEASNIGITKKLKITENKGA